MKRSTIKSKLKEATMVKKAAKIGKMWQKQQDVLIKTSKNGLKSNKIGRKTGKNEKKQHLN